MRISNKKAFTILELLVVVAIIGIIAIIALPNFVGRIEESKASRELAEINAVEKAIATYYAENGIYPTLQGKDGTLVQPQPVFGSPHNIDFAVLVPNYLASLPHFSYWWVDVNGDIFHTQKSIGSVVGGVFTPTSGYSYTLYKTNGTTQVLSAPYTLLAGEYIIGKDEKNVALPKVGADFKNTKTHPESGDSLVTGITLNKATTTVLKGATETLLATVNPSTAPNKTVTWTSSNTSVATVNSSGVVSAVNNGTATVVATAQDGGLTASCLVTVITAPGPYTFTNASATGRFGPTQAQINTSYASTNLNGLVNVPTQGYQLFSISVAGTYRIEAYGAQGGAGSGKVGGTGAIIKGNFVLSGGQQLLLLVGQQGNGGGDSFQDSGGGGGTYVTTGANYATSTPLIIAGGGGGTSYNLNGISATTLTTALNGSPSGSTGGVGGTGGNTAHSSAGGGLYSDGGNDQWGSGIHSGGFAFRNGGYGGAQISGAWAVGGFGGGSTGHGNNYIGGGAGGGYSGGGGASSGSVGGGGGSYNTGANQANSVGNTGMGKVVITYVGP